MILTFFILKETGGESAEPIYADLSSSLGDLEIENTEFSQIMTQNYGQWSGIVCALFLLGSSSVLYSAAIVQACS